MSDDGAPPLPDPDPRRRFRRDLLVLFGLAIGLRGAVAVVRRDAPLSLDSLDYLACARALLDGTPWPAPLRPPGWPLVVSWTLAVGGGSSPIGAQLLNLVLSALVVPVTFALALRALPRPRALAAAALVALHPSLLFLTPAVLTEPLTWLLVTFLALRLTDPDADRRLPLVDGAVAGFLWLVRAACLPLVVAPILLPLSASPRRAALRAAGTAAGALLVVVPLLGLVRARTGLAGSAPGSAEHMFWMGASPERLVPEKERPHFDPGPPLAPGETLADRYRDAALRDWGLLWERSKLETARFVGAKLRAFHDLTSSGRNRGIALASHLPVTLLGLAGGAALLRSRDARGRRLATGVLTLALLLAIPPLVTMPWARYYSPLIPLLAPLVAAVGWRPATETA